MTQNELSRKIKEIKELQVLQEEINDQIESLKDEVKTIMTEQKLEKMLIGTYKVSYKKYIIRRFDSSTFKSEHEALYNQYVKTGEGMRFNIS